MADFFISYNRADRQWAEWIAWQLESAGYTTLLQAWDIRPGENFVLEMQQASVQAERTIAVLSPDYLASAFTASEWAEAFASDPTGESGLLLPVRVRDCEPDGMLGQIVYVNLAGLDSAAARDALLSGVRRGRAKPSHEPGYPGRLMVGLHQQPAFPAENSTTTSPDSGVSAAATAPNADRERPIAAIEPSLANAATPEPNVRPGVRARFAPRGNGPFFRPGGRTLSWLWQSATARRAGGTAGASQPPIISTEDRPLQEPLTLTPSNARGTTLRTLWHRLPSLAKALTALLTAIGGLGGLITALVAAGILGPSDPQPPPSANITAVGLGPSGVTLEKLYYDYGLSSDAEERPLEWQGQIISFQIELVGLESRTYTLQWTLLDATTRGMVPGVIWETIDARPLPFPERQGGEWTPTTSPFRQSGVIWVPLVASGDFFVQLVLRDDQGQEIATAESEVFPMRV